MGGRFITVTNRSGVALDNSNNWLCVAGRYGLAAGPAGNFQISEPPPVTTFSARHRIPMVLPSIHWAALRSLVSCKRCAANFRSPPFTVVAIPTRCCSRTGRGQSANLCAGGCDSGLSTYAADLCRHRFIRSTSPIFAQQCRRRQFRRFLGFCGTNPGDDADDEQTAMAKV